MNKKPNILKKLRIIEDFKRTDKFLLLLILLMTGYGLLMITSVSKAFAIRGSTTQIAATILGLVGMFILSRFDYFDLARLWKLYIPVGYLLQLSLFIWGKKRAGTDNTNWLWIPLGSSTLSIQPSEILKIVFILGYAYHIYVLDENINKPINVFLLVLHALAPIVIINRLGDDGTMLIFVCIIAGMLFSSGIKIKYIIVFVVVVVIVLGLVWFDVGPFGGFIAEYQRDRIKILLPQNRGTDPQGLEWQQDQGLFSLGYGGTFGIGLNSDDKRYVAEIENDFIFTYVGQIWGFIGVMVLIILLFTLCVKILSVGYSSNNKLGGSICVGVFSMVAAQSIINIGMCLKVLPVIGITLPFFSKGGSSIVSILLTMGLVLAVQKHSKSNLFGSKSKKLDYFRKIL